MCYYIVAWVQKDTQRHRQTYFRRYMQSFCQHDGTSSLTLFDLCHTAVVRGGHAKLDHFTAFVHAESGNLYQLPSTYRLYQAIYVVFDGTPWLSKRCALDDSKTTDFRRPHWGIPLICHSSFTVKISKLFFNFSWAGGIMLDIGDSRWGGVFFQEKTRREQKTQFREQKARKPFKMVEVRWFSRLRAFDLFFTM